MFVQVIKGHAGTGEALRNAIDSWVDELSPGATGWLGSTGGVTANGEAIALVRFESEAAARANSERPEQGQWWAQTEKLFDGEPSFSESSEVTLDLAGDPDQAHFVQVMQGVGNNPQRARELMGRDPKLWAEFRPEVLGSVTLEFDAGAFIMAIYFTSEAEAHAGEAKEPPPELKAQMDELLAMLVEPPSFLDLQDPWLHSPK